MDSVAVVTNAFYDYFEEFVNKTGINFEGTVLEHPKKAITISVVGAETLGCIAGNVSYFKKVNERVENFQVSFNEFFLKNEKEFLKRTVPHELAHILVEVIHSDVKQPHGKEWKRIMHIMGCDAKTKHTYNATNLPRKKGAQVRFKYICMCDSHMLSKTRHNKIIKGLATYTCKSCKHVLKHDG